MVRAVVGLIHQVRIHLYQLRVEVAAEGFAGRDGHGIARRSGSPLQDGGVLQLRRVIAEGREAHDVDPVPRLDRVDLVRLDEESAGRVGHVDRAIRPLKRDDALHSYPMSLDLLAAVSQQCVGKPNRQCERLERCLFEHGYAGQIRHGEPDAEHLSFLVEERAADTEDSDLRIERGESEAEDSLSDQTQWC